MTDLAPVTQADRDAVQAFHRAMFDRLNQDLKSDTPTLGEDMGDAGTLVQAFARHRLASTQPAPAFPREKVAEYIAYADALHAKLFYPSGAVRDDAKPAGIARDAIRAIKTLVALLQLTQTD